MKTILLVETHEATRLQNAKILQGAGFLVDQAADISAALELMKEKVPHLILLDFELKGVPAVRFLELRRKKERLKEIPVIAMAALPKITASDIPKKKTGKTTQSEVVKAIQRLKEKTRKKIEAGILAEGASGVLFKPAEARELLRQVRNGLRGANANQVNFEQGQGINVQFKIPAMIIAANEVGFLLEAPVKLAPMASLEIRSSWFEELGCGTSLFRRTRAIAKSLEEGVYINDVSMIGLTSDQILKLKKFKQKGFSK